MKRLAWLAAAPAVWGSLGCESPRSALADADFRAPPIRMQKADQPAEGVKPTVFQAVPGTFPAPSTGEEAVRVRAHVNGSPIFDEEVQQLIYPNLAALSPQLSASDRKARHTELYQEGIQQLIDRELLLQDMEARLSRGNAKQYLDKLRAAAGKEFDKILRKMKTQANTPSDEDFKAILRAQGQSLDGMRRQFERNFMAREYMKGMIFPRVDRATGHQEIVEYYRDHPSEFQQVDSVKWHDIFVDAARYRSREEARAVADQLASRARSGEDVIQLVKYDNGDASYRNGEGLGQKRGEIKPVEAEAILFAMREGESRVLELPNGYHVVRLVKREFAGQLPLDDKTQDVIRKKLQMQVVDKETKRFVEELKLKATIEIDPAFP
jgi:translation initiation factor 2 beta subunit (eIF-2beta)/eIF-5/ribosomal protein L19E